MIDKLGSNTKAHFDKIRMAVYNHVKKSGRDSSKLASGEYFKKFYMQIDGSNYTLENFSLAKYGSILRLVQNITKLGGAAISALTDIGLYGSEMKDQGGKTLLGGMGDAFTALGKIKNTKQKKEFAEISLLMVDGSIHDLAGRNQVGDNLTRGATQVQKTFFKFSQK